MGLQKNKCLVIMIVILSCAQLSMGYLQRGTQQKVVSIVPKVPVSTTKKWYQGRAFKAATAGLCTVGLLGAFREYKIAAYLKKQLDDSIDVAIIDPELYEVFLQIKKDYGITEDVKFRIAHPNSNFPYSALFTYPNNSFQTFNLIRLTHHAENYSKAILIHFIAHELEHCRQNNKYCGSFHPYFCIPREAESLKMETGADAASADYQYCSRCLDEIKVLIKDRIYEPKDGKYGYFTTQTGYFAPQDYDLYTERAREDGALCPAHRDFPADAHAKGTIPLKHYLPTVKPSLPSARFQNTSK